MNYIGEINSFYDWLETNQLSANAINLWCALMATANKALWVNRFTVAISVLEQKTSLPRRTIERARNELKQKGRIEWKSRKGNQSAEYRLISLYDKNNSDFVVQVVVQPVAQVDVQPVAINKQNKTKQNTIKEIFEIFRNRYPGTKRGLDTEFEIFKKRHGDYATEVEKLLPALDKLMEWRSQKEGLHQFVPEYANLQTWINQRRWESELEKIEQSNEKQQPTTYVIPD